MASIINASSSGSGGIVQTADASGVLQLQNNGTIGLTMTSGSIDLPVAGAVISLNRGQYSQQTKFYQDTGGTGAIYETTNPSVNAQYYSHVFKGTNNAPTTLEYARFNQFGLGLGGAIPSSGTGITFPASQSASTDANTLDDYEEGSWTPVITTASSNISYTGQTGTYIKIGKLVYFAFQLNINVVTSNGSGTFNIGGLPYTQGANNYGRFLLQTSSVNFDGTSYEMTLYPDGSTGLNLLYSYDNAGWTVGTAANFPLSNGSILTAMGVYVASA